MTCILQPQFYTLTMPASLQRMNYPSTTFILKQSDRFEPLCGTESFRGVINQTNELATSNLGTYLIDDVVEVTTVKTELVNQTLSILERLKSNIKWFCVGSSLISIGGTAAIYLCGLSPVLMSLPLTFGIASLYYGCRRFHPIDVQVGLWQRSHVDHYCSLRQMIPKLSLNQICHRKYLGQYFSADEGFKLWEQKALIYKRRALLYLTESPAEKMKLAHDLFCHQSPFSAKMIAYFGIDKNPALQTFFTDYNRLQENYHEILVKIEYILEQSKAQREQTEQQLLMAEGTSQMTPMMMAGSFGSVKFHREMTKVNENFETSVQYIQLVKEIEINKLLGQFKELLIEQ